VNFSHAYFVLEYLAGGLPQCPDLMVTRAYLEWHVLLSVKPLRSEAVEHVVLYIASMRIEEFRDCGYMQIESAAVEDLKLFRVIST